MLAAVAAAVLAFLLTEFARWTGAPWWIVVFSSIPIIGYAGFTY